MPKKERKNKSIKINKSYFGWTVLKIEEIKNGSMVFYKLEHGKTGAKYVHLETDDRNNAFAVTFKTKPEDSTGIAHILEHTVLTGSKKYPVRDPFFSMLKRSLQTFMNAFTSEDWTAYPFSTQNEKDFYNLLSVYLDAAFFPQISELNFKQEGWRYDFDGDKLVYKGVVFNEMKGSMSSPNRIMAEAIKQSVFDKSSYRFNSGGDPEKIVDLSHEDLQKFHRRFYHPSNAWFFSYGNLSLAGILEKITVNVLKHYKKEEQNSNFFLEPRRTKGKELTRNFPIAKEDDENKKYQSCVNWLICPLEDGYRVMCAELLFDILIGNPAAPLKRALIESGLGSDMSDDTGYSMEFRDTLFSVGLKDIERCDVPKVKELINSTLKNIRKDGIDKELIEAVMHKQEIYRKEISNSPYPYGLKGWLDIIGSWIHGADPLGLVEYENDIVRLKKELQEGDFFESLIDEYLLKNKHNSQVILKPSKNMQRGFIEKEGMKLEEVKQNLTEDDVKKIKRTAKNLDELQLSEEDLSVLPTVTLDDIDKKFEEPEERQEVVDNFFKYKVSTNGLIYFDCLFDINGVEEVDISFLPLLCYLLSRMGTKNKSYEELARYIDTNTGGIGFSTPIDINKKTGELIFCLVFKGKCLEEKKAKLIEIFQEIVLQFDFQDINLLKRFLLERIARIEARVVNSGHVYAMTLAESGLGEVEEVQERLYGISQLKFLKELARDLSEEGLKKLSFKLEKITKSLISGDRAKIVLLSDGEEGKIENVIKKVFKSLPNSKLEKQDKKEFEIKYIRKVKEIPSAVSFVAAAIKIPNLSVEQKAAFFVLSKMLARGFLHNEIREKGGAYGGFAKFLIHENIFSFGSYRDPHVKNTLEIYARARDFILELDINKEMMDESIIMSIAELDKAKTQAEKAQGDFFDEYTDYEFSLKQKFRNSVLELSEEKIKGVVKAFLPGDWKKMSVAVFGSKKVKL